MVLSSFLVLACFNFRCTQKGYHFGFYHIATASILGSILIGSFVYAFGSGEYLEKTLYRNLPLYKKTSDCQAGFWLAPQKGRLAGVMVDEHQLGFNLKSFDGKNWLVLVDKDGWRLAPFIKKGARLKIIGESLSGNKFIARESAPWLGRGERAFFYERKAERK